MTIAEFEQTADSLTATNTSSEDMEISIGHYGFENTHADKGLVEAKGYPTFRLHYIIGGGLTLIVDGKKIPLKKGRCFLLRPDVNVGYRTDPDNPASFYWVSVSGKKCKTYFADMGFSEELCYLTLPKEYRSALRKAFYANFQVEDTLKEIMGSVFTENFLKIYQILYLAAHRNRSASPETGTKQKAYIEKALDYINEHYVDPELTIKEIARSMFLHENYLSHIFRAAMGLPFREYLTQKRIEKSYTLMEEGMTSVSKVAHEVGFSDSLYFSKVFKRYNGIAPKEHIKKLKKIQTEQTK